MEIQAPFDFELTQDGIMDRIEQETSERLRRWKEMIAEKPESLEEVERETLSYSREMAGYFIAAVLSSPDAKKGVEREAKQIKQEQRDRYKNGYKSEFHEVSFLCGLKLKISSSYLARRQRPKKGKSVRGEEGAGLYPELAALGIQKGTSPALASEACRKAVLLPSYEMATLELDRQGVRLTEGGLRTILLVVGLAALAARKEDLELWRAGHLVPTAILKGKKVAVAFDGGKSRIRISKKGRPRKSGYRGYYTNWREPRLLVIYVLDERGRIDRTYPVVLDGTFQKDSNYIMELAAYHLYRLGASEAESVVFLGDGAEWIWNRVPSVAEKAGLNPRQWMAALDFYHVMEHVNAALKALWGAEGKALKKERKRVEKLLLAGKVGAVLAYLRRHKKPNNAQKAVDGCIAYIEERAKLMDYKKLRAAGLPIGSGAIESAIRRVVNLRLKAPGTFWCEDTAEAVLYMRAQILADNWEGMLERVRERGKYSRRKQYRWEATPMSVKKIQNPKVVLLQQVA